MVEDAHFQMSDPADGKPMLVGNLGDQEMALSLTGIAREFKIGPDSADGQMLGLVARGLKFVCALRIGDKIPQEVITGSASWEPDPSHEEFARKRLVLQAVTWHAGDQKCVIDRDAMEALYESSGAAADEADAFQALAAELGIEDIAGRLGKLVEEVARIEALRDRYREVCRIKGKLDALRKVNASQHGAVDEIDSARRLIRIPVGQFADMLKQADAQTSDIEVLFGNFDDASAVLAELRNELFCWLSAWDEVFESWEPVDPRHPETTNTAERVRELTRFLAPRYMPIDQWELMLSKDEHAAGELRYGGVMTW
ncbi:MAG: hypothetical protein JJ899_16275 [Alphaproteobacteria bacterium]|nr:hypothetical protein [Alphaproteobacteria bacterium]